MTPIDPARTREALDKIKADADGARLEELITELFTAIPGVTIHDRDRLSASGNEELDLAFSNAADSTGLAYFDRDLLVECKSQGTPVDAQAVNWFATKLRRRQQPLGVLVALAGVTGKTSSYPRAAQAEIEMSASEGQQVLVVVADELAGIHSGEHLANLLTLKRQRVVSGRQMLITSADELANLNPIPALPDSATLLLHPASNLAGAEADAWRLSLDAGRLLLRRHRHHALTEVETRRPALAAEIMPGVEGVRKATASIRAKLAGLETAMEDDDVEDEQLRGLVLELAAMCVDLLRLDPASIGAPEPEIVEINVETFGPARVSTRIGSDYWTLLTRYYLDQIESVGEQLRQIAMYALLSLMVQQLLFLRGS